MVGFRTFMLLMQVVLGLLLVGLAIPLIRRKVPPNHWYGFRVRKTLDDPVVWYEANAYAGWSLLAAGIVIVLASVALHEIRALDGETYAVACTLISLGSVIFSLIISFRFLGRIATPTESS